MYTYLFDTSAAFHLYVKEDRFIERTIKHLQEQVTLSKDVRFFLPNFCVVELFNAFARRYFNPEVLSSPFGKDNYSRCLRIFREDIHFGKALYVYDLNRYHIIAAEFIIPIEQKLPLAEKTKHLSGNDILVIAMACELAWIGNREHTRLITNDVRMKHVCDDLRKEIAKNKNALQELIQTGPLGVLDSTRWLPPLCILLKDKDLKAIPTMKNQRELNLQPL